MEQPGSIIEKLQNLDVVSDAQISPGGDRVAFCVSENGTNKGETSPISRIWSHRVDGSQATQLTFGPGTDRQARWSPDGESLAFLSDREKRGTAQLYLLENSPRDARKLTELPAGVDSHQWSPTGESLAVTATDFVPAQENDVKLFDVDRLFRRLYRVDVATGETAPINHGDLHIWEFCWSPDGKALAAIVSDDPFEWAWYSARLVTIDLATGDVTTRYSPERQIARPAWSPDGARIALISCRWSDPGMTGGDVLTVQLDSGTVTNLTEGERRSHLSVHWLASGGQLLAASLASARAQLCRIDPVGGATPIWTADVAFNDYGCTFDPRSGVAATTISNLETPPEVWTGSIENDGASVEMQRLTCSHGAITLPAMSSRWLTWRSVDGLTIEGLYLTPERSAEDTPAMVTLIHGGPTGAASSAFPLTGASAWIPLLIEQGIAVFLPNYRGSNGYGVAFAEANLGDLGGLDLQDVLTGIDACVRLRLADESRLGVGGWSYGGYLTAWAITQTPRFAAAVAGASITNWFSFHGGSNIPGFARQYVGGAPDELDGAYSWTSPLFSSKRVSTPTLFVHGERDPVCPVGQAYEMTRSLRRLGVETECAVYPREPHGFREKAHRRDMVERSAGWFRRHLGAL